MPNLLGAVADADAFSNYLIKHLKVPRSQITDLRDAEATRDNIIGCIRNLKDDDRITNGDSILIFYAGHGASGRAPDRWEAGNKKVESIVPYDCRVIVGGSKVRALPDRTLGALLHQLADVKGDNIVRCLFVSFSIFLYLGCIRQSFLTAATLALELGRMKSYEASSYVLTRFP